MRTGPEHARRRRLKDSDSKLGARVRNLLAARVNGTAAGLATEWFTFYHGQPVLIRITLR